MEIIDVRSQGVISIGSGCVLINHLILLSSTLRNYSSSCTSQATLLSYSAIFTVIPEGKGYSSTGALPQDHLQGTRCSNRVRLFRALRKSLRLKVRQLRLVTAHLRARRKRKGQEEWWCLKKWECLIPTPWSAHSSVVSRSHLLYLPSRRKEVV